MDLAKVDWGKRLRNDQRDTATVHIRDWKRLHFSYNKRGGTIRIAAELAYFEFENVCTVPLGALRKSLPANLYGVVEMVLLLLKGQAEAAAAAVPVAVLELTFRQSGTKPRNRAAPLRDMVSKIARDTGAKTPKAIGKELTKQGKGASRATIKRAAKAMVGSGSD